MHVPNLFIVGAPKCGTNSLYDYLRQHPKCFGPQRKEFHFFGNDLDYHHRPSTQQEYSRYFEDWHGETWTLEASVYHLLSQSAPEEIAAAAPDARIIIMLRRPLDLLVSLHQHYVWLGYEPLSSFDEVMRVEASGRATEQMPRKRIMSERFAPHGLVYFEVCRFTDQVRRYLSVFGEERVHIVDFRCFRDDPQRAFDEVCRFLAIEDGRRIRFEQKNPAKVVRFALLRDFLREPPEWAKMLGRRVPYAEAIRQRAILLNSKKKKSVAFSPETARWVDAMFADEMREMEQLFAWQRDRMVPAALA